MTHATAILLRRALPLLLAGFVAACAIQAEEEFGQCVPGVEEISRTATVCP